MSNFTRLNRVNGFDINDLNNGMQNNYGWSVAQLGNYIYVGTGRNIAYNLIASFKEIKAPLLITPNGEIDSSAEIWRYNINNKGTWQKVYKAEEGENIIGFRNMITHKSFNGYSSLYAAGYSSPNVKILKSTNGVNWATLDNSMLEGTSSRAMISHCGKLYLATFDETSQSENVASLLYSSVDPEFYPWELEIDPSAKCYNPALNPSGGIYNMISFNNRIYVCTSTDDGCQLWRTNGSTPKVNDWTLVADNGFGNSQYIYSLATGKFKDHLYISLSKKIPLSWILPSGFRLVRVNKNDKWQVIVGDEAYRSDNCNRSNLPAYGPGFNNPFNVYGWQIQEYNDKLYITTFDDASNIQLFLEIVLLNKELVASKIGEKAIETLIFIYKKVLKALAIMRYSKGFDLYESDNGINFRPVFSNGLNNPYNYGGRILFKTNRDELVIATSNPFQGCEVWKMDSSEEMCNGRNIPNNTFFAEVQSLINDNYEFLVGVLSKLL